MNSQPQDRAFVTEDELELLLNSLMDGLDAQFKIVTLLADGEDPVAWEAAMQRTEKMGIVLKKLTAMIPANYRNVQ